MCNIGQCNIGILANRVEKHLFHNWRTSLGTRHECVGEMLVCAVCKLKLAVTLIFFQTYIHAFSLRSDYDRVPAVQENSEKPANLVNLAL